MAALNAGTQFIRCPSSVSESGPLASLSLAKLGFVKLVPENAIGLLDTERRRSLGINSPRVRAMRDCATTASGTGFSFLCDCYYF